MRTLMVIVVCLAVAAAAILDGKSRGRNVASAGFEAAVAVCVALGLMYLLLYWT